MITRRGLLGVLGVGAIAAVVPLTDFENLLETARPAQFTLVQLALLHRLDHITEIAEMLSRSDHLLIDLPWRI